GVGRERKAHARLPQLPSHLGANALGERSVGQSPKHCVARERRSLALVEASDVATLFIDRDDCVRVHRVDRGGELPQLLSRGDVHAEQAHAAKTIAEPTLEPVRKLGAVEARQQNGGGHPFTAPDTRPAVMRPCTIMKKMMMGTATRVEAAIT